MASSIRGQQSSAARQLGLPPYFGRYDDHARVQQRRRVNTFDWMTGFVEAHLYLHTFLLMSRFVKLEEDIRR
jgi:hypothetical protein